MATEYLAAATAAATGAAFTLTAGSSRLFHCSPPLGGNEKLTLEILGSDASYTVVGTLADQKNPTGSVTATGEGSSTFKVAKSPTAINKRVDFD